jgi:hypothetical protein
MPLRFPAVLSMAAESSTLTLSTLFPLMSTNHWFDPLVGSARGIHAGCYAIRYRSKHPREAKSPEFQGNAGAKTRMMLLWAFGNAMDSN